MEFCWGCGYAFSFDSSPALAAFALSFQSLMTLGQFAGYG
jgi:hypothetical protein